MYYVFMCMFNIKAGSLIFGVLLLIFFGREIMQFVTNFFKGRKRIRRRHPLLLLRRFLFCKTSKGPLDS